MKWMWLLSVLCSVGVQAESWDSDNDPKRFSAQYEYRFESLPLKGSVTEVDTPWPDTYWPSFKGSINYRWNSDRPLGFGYASPSREMALKLSQAELSKLAPSEKFSLAIGDYSYALKSEVDWHANPRARDWVGICHGWAPAAIQYSEPKPVTVVNPDGISVPFGSSDVKGLMSYYFAFHGGIRYSFIGLRCNRSNFKNLRTPCGDVNPGALHVVLSNEIGIKKTGFIADVEQNREVWNQPIYAYEVTPVGSVRSDRAVAAVQMKLQMFYTDELDDPLWDAVNGTNRFPIAKMDLEYVLELDSEGKITGGEWISAKRPDFLWKANSKSRFSGSFEPLNRIYQPARVGQD